MVKKYAVPAITLLLGLTIGIFGGAVFREMTSTVPPPSIYSTLGGSSQPRQTGRFSPGVQLHGKPGSGAGNDSGPLAGARMSVEQMLEFLDSTHNRLIETRALFRFVDQLEADEFEEVLGKIHEMRGQARGMALTAVYGRWAEIDPSAAFSSANKQDNRDRLKALQAVFSQVATTDPDKAIPWLDLIDTPPIRSSVAGRILVALAAVDPERGFRLMKQEPFRSSLAARQPERFFAAWANVDAEAAADKARQLPETGRSQRILRAIANRWAERDLDAAWAWASSLEEGSQTAKLQAEVLSKLAREDLDLAIQRLNELPTGDARFEAMRDIAREMAHTDPKQAMAFIKKNEFGTREVELMQRVLQTWANSDPRAALSFALNEMTATRAKDNSLRSIIGNTAHHDVDLAKELFAKLEPGSVQRYAAVNIADNIAIQSIEKALAWVDALPDEINGRALEFVMKRWAQDNPKAAAEYALKQGENNEQSLRIVAERWGPENAREAINWYVQNTDEKLQDRVLPSLVAQLADQDLEAAVAWTKTLPEGNLREESYSRLIDRWARYDPESAASWLKRLDDEPARDRAVQTFSQHISRSDPKAAAGWAESIHDESRRFSTMGDVARSWLREDNLAARAWIESSSLPDKQKQLLLK